MTIPIVAPGRERIAAARVLVVGDAMLDRYWFGAVERISPEAPVPVVRVNREEERLGGAANVALNVKKLGAQATLLTVVGDDEPARTLERLLERDGVATLLGRDPQLYTIVKLRVIGRSQQLIRVDFENQPDHEVLAGMLADYETALAKHDAVLFSDYGKGGLEHIPRMIELARAAGKPVLVDPKGASWQRYAGASVITPNRAELAQVAGSWSGEAQLRTKAQALRAELNLAALLVTRSEEGMTVFDAGGDASVPAQAREVFDVTGAGDTVIATLATLMACGLDARESMPWANKAGSVVVSKFGTASASYEEVFMSGDGLPSAAPLPRAPGAAGDRGGSA
ncbi:MAG TPA: D-glycero-beta-D-manno-heptose-7-phosphate kinase [Methylibium sp.]|uniref:D-glycero-beta-D-manno-heptose-7-phosphate kinase n=1 Tax=Methylibium sp. TaxID=2067992 RepID=UPI002DB6B390|nr:D-glycero-beta-D-manno-heptose-7-phosphate kinase [Methylibium sp.]HEU4457644.1 D-glycero-beta-D-manno-heptose-7-phosphate kinase [Methylibium sp.]